MLMKTASSSLAEQLSARFAERIRTRLLAGGARLPSVRQCAQQQGVSASTVVAAYDRLLALGLVVRMYKINDHGIWTDEKAMKGSGISPQKPDFPRSCSRRTTAAA